MGVEVERRKSMAEPAKPKLLGGTAIKPPERHGFEKISYLIYNKDNGEILTRTPKSWALIFIFYVIYYTLLGKIHIGMPKKTILILCTARYLPANQYYAQ